MTQKSKNYIPEIESPFRLEKSLSAAVIDMTKHTGLLEPKEEVLRVELRKVRDAIAYDVPLVDRIVEDSFVIGLIERTSLPKEGHRFSMPYHKLSSGLGYGSSIFIDFGHIDTKTDTYNVLVQENLYFFETNEGVWRLKILHPDN